MIQIKWCSEPVDWWDDPDLQYLAFSLLLLAATVSLLWWLDGFATCI